MITILKVLNSAVGGWITLFLVMVSGGISLVIFKCLKNEKSKKIASIYISIIFGIVIIFDLICLLSCFPNGEYFDGGIKGMAVLVALPCLISLINILIIIDKKDSDNKENIFLKSLLFLSIITLFICLYNLINYFLYENNLIFRGWIDKLYFFAGCSFIFLVIIVINFYLYKLMKKSYIQKFLSVLSTMASIFITPILIMWMMFIYAFTSYPEHTVYEHSRYLIAKVSTGFHHSTVSYYEPVNFMIMRKTSIPEEMYDGSYDKYDRIE